MNNPWNLQLLTRWEEVSTPSFTEQWLAIVEASPDAHVFFHPVFVNVWLETYRPLRDLQPLFVHASCGEQEVIFPLVLWKRNWKNAFLRVVVPAGHSDFDYHDPIFLHRPTADQIQSFYETLKKVLDDKVDYDQIYLDGLHRDYLPSFTQVQHEEACLSSSLQDAPLKEGLVVPSQKSQARAVLRRLRRLEELGKVAFYRHTAAEVTAAESSLDLMLSMHTKRWPNAYKAPGFHHKLVHSGLKSGLLDFVEMSQGGMPIAWQISFAFRGRYSLYMPAVDENYYKFSSGFLVMGYALGEAANRGFTTVDHLRGAEGYKDSWGGDLTRIYDAVFERKSLSSKLRFFVFRIFLKMKQPRASNTNDQASEKQE